MGHPMRIELTRAGLLVYLANHYTTRGAQVRSWSESVGDKAGYDRRQRDPDVRVRWSLPTYAHRWRAERVNKVTKSLPLFAL